MRYEKIEKDYHIYTEKGEAEQELLRALVKASFELARPAGSGWTHFQEDAVMPDEDADQFISLPPRWKDTVVKMDCVQGRQCTTSVSKVTEGHFKLDGWLYEQDRGTPEALFKRVTEILAGKPSQGLVSTSYMYRGDSLTLRLKEEGFTRNPGESDWDFRKRIFPDFSLMDEDRAIEFLMGGSATEWDELDMLPFFALVSKGEPTRQELIKFAEGFTADPLEMRARRQAAPMN